MKTFTRDEYNKLKAELEYLTDQGRTEMAAKLQEARSHGDLSENAEYDEARNDQARQEARIAFLEAELEDARIIEEGEILDVSTVHVGFTVTYEDLNSGKSFTYKILGGSDIFNGIISVQSPVGSALVGKSVGDVVEVNCPNGTTLNLKVTDITR